MKIWVDDLRTPPDYTWYWCKDSESAIQLFNWHMLNGEWDRINAVSLDHDLGDEDTSRRIVMWFCDHAHWPDYVQVHSANPVGTEWLEGMIERYKQ